jgi:type IV pilus assembly protein PilY1
MLMLLTSKDHTLFSPIYTDFEDLDGDGIIDTTFKPDFKYYGYFDATKCYTYSSSRFNPARVGSISTTSATTSGSTVAGRYVCGNSNEWSGNYLNWATTTRLDVIRKMLYGGQRSTDSTTETILSSARLTRDSHSFVKYYRGTDIRDYTPFTTSNLTKTSGSNANTYAGLTLCMQGDDNNNGLTGTPKMRMAKGNYRLWSTVEGGTVCDWGGTLGNKLNRYYGGSSTLAGNTITYQGNGGVNHEASSPSQSTDGATYNSLGPDLNVRVKVCDSSLLGEERCQAYGSSTVVYKPVGLLQDFGTNQSGSTAARTEFGLITGSYDKNLTAGALRKNMNDMLDEIKSTTGQFCFSSGASCSGTLADGRSYTSTGAIKALDQIVLYGKNSGGYDGSDVQLPSEMSNGELPAWGNPIGEMLVQALSYYGGKTSSNPSSTTNDTSVSMPVSSWSDPMSESNTTRVTNYGKPICRPLNILALSSSALSFDGDDADTVFSALPNRSRGTLSEFTDAVGVAEGIHGTLRSVGSVTGGYGETCSGKTVSSLSQVSGVCPEAPAVGGTYKIAGAALYANTNRIKTVTSVPTDLPAWALKVKTYAASLAGGVARVEVPIPNTSPTKYVYITPEGLWAANSNAKKMTSAMLTFNAISSSSTHGAFIVTWNDSLFGGDYDMDIAGYLRYDVLTPLSPSTKYRLKITTDIINVGAGWTGSHGFSVIGTNNFDGRYLTHRHLSDDSVMSSATGYLCGNSTYRASTNLSTAGLSIIPTATGNGSQACDVSSAWNAVRDRDSPVTLTFEMNGADSVTLRDPLWYAAKYGAFTPTDATISSELPNLPVEWDARRNDGRPCGGSTGLSCTDGEPDGYFLARRPELLEKQLRDTLETIISSTNSAPAVSSSQLDTGSFKYIATFDPSQNSGTVLAYELGSNGNFASTPSWDVGQKLSTVSANTRAVITNDSVSGVALKTSTSFSTTFLDNLRGTGGTALTSTQGDELVNYLRGDRTKEKPTGIWRARSISNVMGPIVNSSPWLQGRPAGQNFGSFATGTPTYGSFVSAQSSRDRLIWVGANDGMLHGFKAQGSDGGTPVISYVPSPMISRLKTLAQDSTSMNSGMDGSPYTGDVLLGSGSPATWKTYLFSSLGRGARAFFALDVTNPANLSEANASSIFKWMFSSSDDADLGYVLGDHQSHPGSNQATPIVRMNNDKFAVLVPNGLGSGNGTTSAYAQLFILFVDGPTGSGTWTSGTHYIKIPTDTAGSNGLVGVNWVDTNNDGKVDTIYGTDLLGRLWKFDVSSATTSNWKSAFPSSGTGTPLPLFEAKDGSTRLPITTSPTVSTHPSGGWLVAFGTGIAVDSGNFPNSTRTQRFFSIYDRPAWGTRPLPVSDRSTLIARTLARTSDGDVYVATGTTAFDPASHDGWFLTFAPLSSSSSINDEMVLSAPQLQGGILRFVTVRPSTASANKCYATPEGTGYAIDPISGTPKATLLGTVPVVVNGATIQVNKAGIKLSDQKVTSALQQSGTKGNFKIIGQNTNINLPEFLRLMRRQWREIPGMRTDQ